MIGDKSTANSQRGPVPLGVGRVKRPQALTGFTLIEVLLAVGVLTILAGTASGALISAMRAYQEVTAVQNMTDNVQFALEYMSRQMRLARRSTGSECSSFPPWPLPAGVTFQTFPNIIQFVDYQSRCIVYIIAAEMIFVSTNNLAGPFLPLTSSSMVRISFPEFIIRGGTQGDGLQPRVMIKFRAQGVTQNIPKGPTLSVQTSVSTRSLDALP